jgi:hypothetical protein
MPRLQTTIGQKSYRLHKFNDESYDIQELINGVWNTIDTFGKVYYGSPRPYAYAGYSFATPGLVFQHFIKHQVAPLPY